MEKKVIKLIVPITIMLIADIIILIAQGPSAYISVNSLFCFIIATVSGADLFSAYVIWAALKVISLFLILPRIKSKRNRVIVYVIMLMFSIPFIYAAKRPT